MAPNVTVYDSIKLDDTTSISKLYHSISVSNSISISESVNRSIEIKPSAIDSMVIGDSVSVALSVKPFAVSDSIGMTDSVAITFNKASVSKSDSFSVSEKVIVLISGQFGDWGFKFGQGSQITIPDPTEFKADPVVQSGVHYILNGKVRRDIIGNRHHFFIAWEGLLKEEFEALSYVNSYAGELYFVCHLGAFKVQVVNMQPASYSHTGYISTAMEMEETL